MPRLLLSMRSSRASPRPWQSSDQGAVPGRLLGAAGVFVAVGVVGIGLWITQASWAAGVGIASLVTVSIAGVFFWRRRARTMQDSAEHQPPSDSDARARMIERVRHRCVVEGLDTSLKAHTQQALGLDREADLVQRRMQHQRRGRDPELLPAGTTVRGVFGDVDGGLLILGSAGSGKTTALLELARDLLNQAAQDAERPIPVVCNLSSWAQHQPRFADWLTEELRHSYEVPRQIAGHWVDSNKILPLLDDLDEVSPRLRDNCVTAINRFLDQHHVDLVMCGPTDEYQRLTQLLRVENAVVLQPLTRDEVGQYLETVGLGEVRTALKADERLRELVETPLMLNIVALAYQGKRPDALLMPGTIEQRREQLFADYTERMFARRPITRRYTKEQAKRWLAWLARSMRERNQSEFDLDRLQPEWLPTAWQRRLVTFVPAVISAVVGGLLVELVVKLAIALSSGPVVKPDVMPSVSPGVALLAGLVFALVAVGGGRTHKPFGRLGWPWLGVGLGVGLVAGLAAGLRLGLVVGLFALSAGLVYELADGDSGKSAVRWSWPGLSVGLGVGLIFGLVFGLGSQVIVRQFIGVAVGLAAGLVGWLIYELIRSDGAVDAPATIYPVEELHWAGLSGSLRATLRVALGSGVGVGVLSVLLRWLRGAQDILRDVVLDYGLGSGLGVAVAVVLVVVLFGGLGSGLAKGTVTPKEGIRRSARRALAVGLGSGLVVAIAGLGVAVVIVLRGRLVDGLAAGLVNGLVFGMVFGLIVGLEFGGIACLRYLTLHGLLARSGAPPWRFLDDAAERLFLHKSGGSYLFRHPLLLDYFANRQVSKAGSTTFLNTTEPSLKERRPGFQSTNGVVDADEEVVEAGDVAE
jgi:DNA polymerase III delta prime subunit